MSAVVDLSPDIKSDKSRFGYDPDFTSVVYDRALSFVAEEYFRAELINKTGRPWKEVFRGPAIFSANHSGMTLSWDNIIFDYLVYSEMKHLEGPRISRLERKLRRLVDPLLISVGRADPFFISDWWTRTGCVPASFDNFRTLLSSSELVLVSPEGVAGIAKGFSKRYSLQPFSSSLVALGNELDVEVYPVSVINAEYLRPFNYNVKIWSSFVRQHIKLSFMPVGLGASQLICGATYLTPFPAKLRYVIHPPIRISHYLTTVHQELKPKIDQNRRASEVLRRHQQGLLNEEREQAPPIYSLGELAQVFRSSRNKRFFDPFFWHERFHRAAGVPKVLSLACKFPIIGLPLAAWVRRRLEQGAGRSTIVQAKQSSTSL
ncbi:hypothetical protein [Marinobacter sp. LN3S78]|uniref:hypothetical protein n=1 Tax=Marinobacter sp. LN3S78 TaxID=3382300 RepID=UPI00387B962B